VHDFHLLLDPADEIEFIVLLLDESDLLADEVDYIFVVIEEVLQVDFVIEFDDRAFLEEDAV
jgi:hypothetical protein